MEGTRNKDKRLEELWPSSAEVMKTMAEQYPEVLISFSGGKDCVAAWLAMREAGFERIVPVFMHTVPNLGFIETGLKYFEEFFQTRIVRVPSPNFYKVLHKCVYQTPWSAVAIRDADLPVEANYNYDTIRTLVGYDEIGDPDAWIAVGTRAKDSVTRAVAFRKHGPVREGVKKFFPVWDWDKKQLVETIRKAGVKLPAEYRVFGRSFDGLALEYIWGIRKYWPDDYARICAWFPLIPAEIARYEFWCKRNGYDPEKGRF